MKKTLFILIALFALAGCQKQENQEPSTDQRKDIGHKLIMKSLSDLQNKDLKSTIVDLETSIKIDPSEPAAYLLLGQILLKIQEYDHAADFLEMTAKNFPDDGTVFYMLSIADKMSGKKLPAVLAARHSVEVFQAQQDRDNMLKSAALLHELIDTPDNQFVPAKNQDAAKAPDNADQT
jgi:outer membrane protein assembly factor BamD (BamD/ComL family)